jgi:hypothetical protein
VFGSGRGDGGDTAVVIGRIVYVVPYPPAGASGELLAAFSARATASVTGHCPACGARRHLDRGADPARATASVTGHCPACGARRHLDRGADHVADATFHHEDDCPACDDNLAAALDESGS